MSTGFGIKSQAALHQNRRVVGSLAALNQAAVFSVLRMSVRVRVYFQRRSVSSALNTCSGNHPSPRRVF
jgi:hypothetical protein